jgi:4-coumarate--CoA ligase
MQMRIPDDASNDVPQGTPDELIVRSPFVTYAYFNNPEGSTATLHDGWFCTSDITVDRDGNLCIIDRKKELV